jgi:hypothetical protein
VPVVDLPYEEDFFQRIVNVNWKTGVVFIYGTEFGNQLYYVKIGGPDSKPVKHTITLPEPATIIDYGAKALFGARGSSYAKVGGRAVFLLCGTSSNFHEIVDSVGNQTGVIDYHAVIFASNDGINWGIVREQAAINDSLDDIRTVQAVALVWSAASSTSGTLQAGAFHYDQTHGDDSGPHEQIFSSSSGAGWSQSGGYFPSFCTSNDCLDAKGQNVPDGVMANDTKTQTAAQPVNPPAISYDTGIIDYATNGTDKVKVTVVPPEGFSSTASMPGIAIVTCVAGCNGIFMAGGYSHVDDSGEGPGAVVLSTDGGKTWKPFASTPTGVVTMIAAPAGDIKSS